MQVAEKKKDSEEAQEHNDVVQDNRFSERQDKSAPGSRGKRILFFDQGRRWREGCNAQSLEQKVHSQMEKNIRFFAKMRRNDQGEFEGQSDGGWRT